MPVLPRGRFTPTRFSAALALAATTALLSASAAAADTVDSADAGDAYVHTSPAAFFAEPISEEPEGAAAI
ncbi:hypothetical protein HNR23_003434 [Nocardiopsis mwathae]|uniref:Uncharacterized protein n=1 Tax=Nocardiopsis mwathae TaxID=1472723 RepID=A0A7X0D7U5_9ACTN|nr:hypothetical protein [Nocardiopsis mwathae]MBB6173374.1 hypothetical protein [Nocardiopsis mwathae]